MRKPSFFRAWYIHYSVLVLLLLLICSFVEATAATREIDTDGDGDEVSDEIYTEVVVIWEDLLLEPFGHDDDDADYTREWRRTRSFLPSAVAEPVFLGLYAVRYFDHDRETLKYRL